MTPDDAKVDVLAEAQWLRDAWCERRSYDAICTMHEGLRSINGLTDGWEEFVKALKLLRVVAEQENGGITEAELQTVNLLVGVVSRALNSRR